MDPKQLWTSADRGVASHLSEDDLPRTPDDLARLVRRLKGLHHRRIAQLGRDVASSLRGLGYEDRAIVDQLAERYDSTARRAVASMKLESERVLDPILVADARGALHALASLDGPRRAHAELATERAALRAHAAELQTALLEASRGTPGLFALRLLEQLRLFLDAVAAYVRASEGELALRLFAQG